MEAILARQYEHKPRSILCEGKSVTFNDSLILLTAGSYSISQTDHIRKLQPVPPNATLQRFIAERARGAYLASVSRPDLTYGFAACSQFRTPTATPISLLNNTIANAYKHHSRCLQYLPLDIATCHIAVFADASFGNNKNMSLQIGFIICLVGDTNTVNVLYYSSIKTKRIARSALETELLAIAHAFDQASTLQLSINAILEHHIHLNLYTDSRS